MQAALALLLVVAAAQSSDPKRLLAECPALAPFVAAHGSGTARGSTAKDGARILTDGLIFQTGRAFPPRLSARIERGNCDFVVLSELSELQPPFSPERVRVYASSPLTDRTRQFVLDRLRAVLPAPGDPRAAVGRAILAGWQEQTLESGGRVVRLPPAEPAPLAPQKRVYAVELCPEGAAPPELRPYLRECAKVVSGPELKPLPERHRGWVLASIAGVLTATNRHLGATRMLGFNTLAVTSPQCLVIATPGELNTFLLADPEGGLLYPLGEEFRSDGCEHGGLHPVRDGLILWNVKRAQGLASVFIDCARLIATLGSEGIVPIANPLAAATEHQDLLWLAERIAAASTEAEAQPFASAIQGQRPRLADLAVALENADPKSWPEVWAVVGEQDDTAVVKRVSMLPARPLRQPADLAQLHGGWPSDIHVVPQSQLRSPEHAIYLLTALGSILAYDERHPEASDFGIDFNHMASAVNDGFEPDPAPDLCAAYHGTERAFGKPIVDELIRRADSWSTCVDAAKCVTKFRALCGR